MTFTPAFTDKDRAMRPRLYILAGVPGCGKSTWARNFFKDYQIVSTDLIREEKWSGEPYDAAHNQEVFDEFHKRLGEMLYKGMDAVADATSLSAFARTELRAVAEKELAETHLVFFQNPEQAVGRNARRRGNAVVPHDAMAWMLEKYDATVSAIVDEKYTSTTIIEDLT